MTQSIMNLKKKVGLYVLTWKDTQNNCLSKKKRKLQNSIHFFLIYFCFYLFTYLFLAALGLHCWVRALSSCGERGLLLVVVHGLLTAVSSLAAEHRL